MEENYLNMKNGHIKGNILETSTSYKYLGVYFTNHLSWSLHVKYASVQARKVLIGILRHVNVLGDMNITTFFKIFDVKIVPILLYGAEIWGLNHFEKLESIQLLYCKKFLGVKTNTPNTMIYGECGRYPLYIQSQVKVIKYWLRLLDMPSSRLPRKCYNMMLLYDKNGQKNWVTGVKDLLFSIGFGYIWNNQEAGIELGFLQLFIQRIKDMYLQKWFERTSLSRKCDFFLFII